MSFEIDRQTLRDLEIFGERPQDPDIFRYYNRTKTFGGKLQLKAIMEYPLDNIDELTERRDTIKFFRDFEFQLTINSSQMDFIDHYFRLNETTLKANFLDVLFNKIRVNPNAKNDLYLIATGVEKMIFLLIELEKMLTAAATKELPPKLASTFTFLRDFLQLTEISRMIKEIKAKPHRIRTYKYDRLFRDKYKDETQQVVQAIYAFDAYHSVAETAALKESAFPEYASLAIIESLADIHGSTFFVSTHITEIAQQLQHNENIQFKFFDTKLVDNQPVYSYRLHDGVSHERHGMLIVRNENILDILKSIKTV